MFFVTSANVPQSSVIWRKKRGVGLEWIHQRGVVSCYAVLCNQISSSCSFYKWDLTNRWSLTVHIFGRGQTVPASTAPPSSESRLRVTSKTRKWGPVRTAATEMRATAWSSELFYSWFWIRNTALSWCGEVFSSLRVTLHWGSYPQPALTGTSSLTWSLSCQDRDPEQLILDCARLHFEVASLLNACSNWINLKRYAFSPLTSAHFYTHSSLTFLFLFKVLRHFYLNVKVVSQFEPCIDRSPSSSPTRSASSSSSLIDRVERNEIVIIRHWLAA